MCRNFKNVVCASAGSRSGCVRGGWLSPPGSGMGPCMAARGLPDTTAAEVCTPGRTVIFVGFRGERFYVCDFRP